MEPPGRKENNLQWGAVRGNQTAVCPPSVPTAVLNIPMALQPSLPSPQPSSVSPHQAWAGASMQRRGCRMRWRAKCKGYRYT